MVLQIPSDSLPIGYAALVEQYALRVVPHHRWSFVATKGAARELKDGRVILRAGFANATKMGVVEHLTFALKHDGVNLAILAAVFEAHVDPGGLEEQLTAALRETPHGIYLRRLWFLYEWLTDRRLAIPPMHGRSIPLLDEDEYITGPERLSSRHRIKNNLLGTPAFCPVVRRTAALDARDANDIPKALARLVSRYDQAVFLPAIAFLYTKETMSSFAIEHERPSKSRAQRFVELLHSIQDIDPWSEQALAALQSQIVDERYAENAYRSIQNYVGQSISLARQQVHYVPPKPEDVHRLMSGLVETAKLLMASKADPVVVAACLSFGLVFIHPFVDGNGRLHRLLIHNTLARRGVTPRDVVAPVSAVMLGDRVGYDSVLETFSKPLDQLLRYEVSEHGDLTVEGATAHHYRYIDFTPMAEALYGWIERAIHHDLLEELDFLVGVERTREAMRDIVDMPDRDADLFIKVCLHNAGELSATKRNSHFFLLTDEEITRLERAVRDNMPERAISRA